jgi:ankyrin repeat protein
MDDQNVFLLLKNGDINRINALLSNGLNVNHMRWSGYTLLHKAASFGDTDMCAILIQHGANLESKSMIGWYTPLHIALANGYIDTAYFLIEKGANIRAQSKYNEDPFVYGINRGFRKITEEFRIKVMKMKVIENLKKSNPT